eukprot:SAG11_NODE_1740_length_4338_cov_2.608634_3_plen_181_part_00
MFSAVRECCFSSALSLLDERPTVWCADGLRETAAVTPHLLAVGLLLGVGGALHLVTRQDSFTTLRWLHGKEAPRVVGVLAAYSPALGRCAWHSTQPLKESSFLFASRPAYGSRSMDACAPGYPGCGRDRTAWCKAGRHALRAVPTPRPVSARARVRCFWADRPRGLAVSALTPAMPIRLL